MTFPRYVGSVVWSSALSRIWAGSKAREQDEFGDEHRQTGTAEEDCEVAVITTIRELSSSDLTAQEEFRKEAEYFATNRR